MSKSNAFETAYLQLVFLNTPIANIGDATGLRCLTPAIPAPALHVVPGSR